MMVGPTSYPMTTTTAATNSSNNSSMMISPNPGGGGPTMIPQPSSANRFPFSSSKPLDSLNNNAGPYDGSSGFSIDASSASAGKKKRGRPRKYSPDGNIALGLAPTPISASSAANHGEPASASAGSGPASMSEPTLKKHRGRPPGSGKKQLDALGAGGVGFTPHVIMVKAGEDIATKIMAFSQQGPRTVCILSANGAICNVTLRQPAMSGGTVTYEGRFEIISLSGSFLLSENNGNRSRTGGLSVSLAGSDGRVLGGGVAGMLMAASPVQVIVGSFIADGKKPNSNNLKSGPSAAPVPQMLNFGAPLTVGSPPSQGASSESSDDDGGSPINRGPGYFSNTSQPIHNMQMYHHMWAGQAQQ
ncbi:AT-hook motif nuclear-localized protein 13-like [Corylus avellana]|uniref:AT-hook motif nuclear-localized protein 13-like n=1 Tax=Corylus avellana TaxID=13451 RepID=UPI00286CA693|nr:AT-hook motif nuclear-localized protein 13-like [Corylus avellana]